ncbi:uncharacterized protein LOC118434342 [Folsomia candida]|uniref:uncharacterized protein LOC118434340 n=1 Tax=Folsomia candida TaxID=158441 RepID=UPI001605259A|nr:uncharacterized protein LOC118434340 [Folsomia candida]XP_035703515.1 uncharacterized protein LOC118434341 [Folsomia candida]XP_035703516.1 uncharacterized protein LOC118434342 [Folsomia candida]
MAQNSTKFSVVLFTKEKSVAAVPTTWLLEEKGRTFCKWPKGPNAATLVHDGNSVPRKGWSSFPVKIYRGLGSDDYTTANTNADEARALTSPSEEESPPSSPPTPVKVNSKPRQRQHSSDSETNSRRNFDTEVPDIDTNRSSSVTIDDVEETVAAHSSQAVFNLNIAGAEEDQSESQLNYATFSAPLTVTSQGFEVNVLSYLIDIKTELSRLSAQVAAIAAGSDSGEDSGEEFQLPIATEEQLMEIELKLNERGARKILFKQIVKVGGLDIKDTVERVLAKVFGQAIAEQTSLTGRSNKFAFDKLKLFNVIVDAILKNPLCSNKTQKDVEVEATRWFGNAKDRDGGRERRRNKKLPPANN